MATIATDYETYKKNRIDELKRNYKKDLARLYNYLIHQYRRIIYSRLINKGRLIQILFNGYNRQLSILKKNLKNSIEQLNNSVPEFQLSDISISNINKKALLIGINYKNTPYELSGCIDDANRIKDFLTERGFNEHQIMTDDTDLKPTRENILNTFQKWIMDANEGDLLFFYFSGHGSYTYDKNKDEIDGRDETIISLDLQDVIDDELKHILSNHLKKGVTVVGLFDSCHSGTLFDLKYNYLDSNHFDNSTENNKVSECEGNVLMISGCMDAQTSAEAQIENKPQGAMTWAFLSSINTTPNLSWRELLINMRDLLKNNSYTQVPQLSTDSFYDIGSPVFI